MTSRMLKNDRQGLRRNLQKLWQGKIFLVTVPVICAALVWFLLAFVPPQYQANGKILLKPYQGAEVVRNEAEILRSRNFLQDVIVQSKLLTDPELIPNPGKIDILQESINQSGAKFKTLKLENSLGDQTIDRAVDLFQARLVIDVQPDTSVINLAYRSGDAEQAAFIVNKMIGIYAARFAQANAGNENTQWLRGRLNKLRAQVTEAKAELSAFRRTHDLAGAPDISPDDAADIQGELITLKSERAGIKSRFERLNNGQRQTINLENAQYFNTLRGKEQAILQELDNLSTRYGPKHPEIIALNEQLSRVRTNLRYERETMIRRMNTQLEALNARIEILQGAVQPDEGQGERTENRARERELIRDLEAAELIYNTFIQTYRNAEGPINQALEAPRETYIEILSRASRPQSPVIPNREEIVFWVILITFLITALALLLTGSMNNSYRSAHDLEQGTGVPCFGMIPRAPKIKPNDIGDYVLDKPASSLAEAVRTLKTVTKLRGGDGAVAPKIIAVTSSFPGEGKTTLSCWTARLAAKSGEKTILIDFDMRRPRLHHTLRGRDEKTLVDYLSGQAKLEEIIHKDAATGLHVIYARAVPNSALDLADSAKAKYLIASLRQVYDTVIIDTPATLAVADARVLALQADHVLYCVGWNKTHVRAVATGLKQFPDIGQEHVATVLTGVDVARHAKLGYGDTAYYYGRDEDVI